MSTLNEGSGARVDGCPFPVHVLEATEPEQAVSNTKLAFDAGARIAMFTSSGPVETTNGYDPNRAESVSKPCVRSIPTADLELPKRLPVGWQAFVRQLIKRSPAALQKLRGRNG